METVMEYLIVLFTLDILASLEEEVNKLIPN